jgi:hypothetical protein
MMETTIQGQLQQSKTNWGRHCCLRCRCVADKQCVCADPHISFSSFWGTKSETHLCCNIGPHEVSIRPCRYATHHGLKRNPNKISLNVCDETMLLNWHMCWSFSIVSFVTRNTTFSKLVPLPSSGIRMKLPYCCCYTRIEIFYLI